MNSAEKEKNNKLKYERMYHFFTFQKILCVEMYQFLNFIDNQKVTFVFLPPLQKGNV